MIFLTRTVRFFVIFSLAFSFSCHVVLADISEDQAGKTFADIAKEVQKNYVKEIPMNKLLEGALRGMLESLDDYSTYLDQEEFKQIKTQFNGEFGGIGVELLLRRGRLIVHQVYQGSPAENEGIEAGDIILKVNGRNLVNLTATEVMNLMRGRKGTKVTLTIRRGTTDVFDVEITRDSIKILPIESKIRHNVGIIKMPSFVSQNTTKDFRNALQKMLIKTPKLDALVLDLRDNPGGLIDEAVGCASLFVPKGIITYTQGRTNNSKETYKATGKPLPINIPVVILVNGETASSAEIFTGALQDYKYAVVVGEKTHGKGSVQVVSPMKNGAALKMTIANYFTPEGRIIDHEGLKPDILITQPKMTFSNEDGLGGKVRSIRIDADPKITDTTEQEPGQELAQDPQLYQAIFIAKGLRFTTRQTSPAAS